MKKQPTKKKAERKGKGWSVKVTVWTHIDGRTFLSAVGEGRPDWLSAGSFVKITPTRKRS